ncbi:MAG: hypothetical protein JWM86_277 [Thermoleophilia bacterium]|nr:hypothetical protein [Thermoleophilia bacterium]
MKTTRLLAAIVALVACAALLAGCGGPSKKEYEKDVRSVGNSVEKDIKALDSGTPTAKDLDSAQKSLDDAADELDDIDAPDDVSKLHDDLVDTLHDTSDLLGKMGPLMDKATKDPTSLGADEMKDLQKITTDFAAIEKRMKKIEKGYKDKDYSIGLSA